VIKTNADGAKSDHSIQKRRNVVLLSVEQFRLR